jgi:hypothetical protein
MPTYLLYLSGVLLLALPSGPLIRRYLKTLTLSEMADRPGARLGWVHPLNAFDLVRGYAGAMLILAAFASIHPAAPGQLPARMVLIIAATAGLLIQHSLHKTKEETMHAPFAYLTGLTLAILPLKIALFALPIGSLAAIGMRHIAWGFIMTAVAAGAFGLLFKQNYLTLATACFLLIVPVLLSRLVNRSLVIAVRPGAARVDTGGYGRLREI